MGKKKRVVEGLVMNLDDFMNSDIQIETFSMTKTEDYSSKLDEDIVAAIRSKFHCDSCKRYIYSSYLRSWRGRYLCEKCYIDIDKDISPEITEYIKEITSHGCVFCGVKGSNYHFDHINMFSKVNSVMAMVNAGESVEDIKTEIGKCQLLCVDCHMFVTRFELRRGFIKEKRRMNRAAAAGKDVSELRQELYDKYEAVMTKVYPLIREKVREVAHVGDPSSESGGGIDGENLRHKSDESDESLYGDCDEENNVYI